MKAPGYDQPKEKSSGSIQPSVLLHLSACVCGRGFWGPVLEEVGPWAGDQGPDRRSLSPPQVTAAWTEATAVATATGMAQAPSTVKVRAGQGRAGERRRELRWGLGASASTEPDFFPLSLGPISEEGLGASVASLSSENPYATIRDLPSLLGSPRESSYMEMKGPPSGSPPRQPPQLRDSQRRRHPQPERDSGTYEQPSPLTHGEPSFSTGAERTGTGEVGEEKGQRAGMRSGHEVAARARPLGIRLGLKAGMTFGKSHCLFEPVGGGIPPSEG